MRNLSLALLAAVLWGIPGAKASDVVDTYPETVAVLQLLHGDEVSAAHTYRAYARQARQEKHQNIESFFAALAWSATTRAAKTAALLERMEAIVIEPPAPNITVSTTRLNLRFMANVEAPRMEKRYPLLIERIKREGHAVAIQTVTHAWKVDAGQRKLGKSVLSSMEAFLGIGARIPSEFYVCQNCGSVDAGMPELTCPVCGGPISDYKQAHANWRFYRAIDNNPLLNDEEKAFARRMYEHIYASSDPTEHVTVASDALYSDVYRKWGLGSGRDFCLEEKIYIAGLEEMANIWETYQAIDTNNFDEADRVFLQEMHERYGNGRINLRREFARERGKTSSEAESVLETVEIVTGNTELSDRDLIFFRELISKSQLAG